MGLLDVLNGMRNGPRGGATSSSSGGMSPITMAILALLAYKGIKHMGGGSNPAAPQPNPQRIPDGSATTGGGLGDILGGLLKGPGGAAAAGDLAAFCRAGSGDCWPEVRRAAC